MLLRLWPRLGTYLSDVLGFSRLLLKCRGSPAEGSARTPHISNFTSTGGEVEPSPPWRFARDAPSLGRLPLLRYGAGLARQTCVPRFCLRRRADISELPPRIGLPRALVVSASSAQATRSASPNLTLAGLV